MDTLLLDQTRWDLCLDASGDIALATVPYAAAQDVASAIRLFFGELWYDTTKGIPYFGQILGRFPPPPLIKAQLIRAALTVPGVTGAQCFLSAIVGRNLSGQVAIRYGDGAANSTISFVGNTSGLQTSIGVR